MQKGFMYIDETIKLNFDMPDELRDYVKGMDKAFEENDTVSWDFYHEAVGSLAKGFYNMGLITSRQMHDVWERYGTAG